MRKNLEQTTTAVLFLYGPPPSGKTTLIKALTEARPLLKVVAYNQNLAKYGESDICRTLYDIPDSVTDDMIQSGILEPIDSITMNPLETPLHVGTLLNVLLLQDIKDVFERPGTYLFFDEEPEWSLSTHSQSNKITRDAIKTLMIIKQKGDIQRHTDTISQCCVPFGRIPKDVLFLVFKEIYWIHWQYHDV